MISVEIDRDSIALGSRLTTFILRYPRFLLAQMNTHRVFSRNAASSRALPTAALLRQVMDTPAKPLTWRARGVGMQPAGLVVDLTAADRIWCEARDSAVASARSLNALGAAKEIVNRLLEPFVLTTQIVSSTSWDNFFALRINKDAQHEISVLAVGMRTALSGSTPVVMSDGDWHLPLTGYAGDETLGPRDLRLVSAARCARISYLTHEGRRDVKRDIQLAYQLVEAGHWSPFEHVAEVCRGPVAGNFGAPWAQYRHELAG